MSREPDDIHDDPDDDVERDADDVAANLPVLVEPESTLVPTPLGTDPGQLESGDTLTVYMAQLRSHPPISREEEQKLARRWVEFGDVDAARQLVVSNLRLVVKIAMEYRRAWPNALDRLQEGNQAEEQDPAYGPLRPQFLYSSQIWERSSSIGER